MKVGLGIVWIWAALSFVAPMPLAALGRGVFAVMLVVHLLEFVFFRSKLQQAPGTLGHHFAQTMLFGVLHLREQKGESDPAS